MTNRNFFFLLSFVAEISQSLNLNKKEKEENKHLTYDDDFPAPYYCYCS